MALLGLDTLLEQAAREPGPLNIDYMDAALAIRSRFLYTLLVQVCGGKGLAIVRLVSRKNGFEAWRQLEAEYSPAVPSRTVALLV
eukprot:13675357-Heterocapsa_arctica.AAC.1